MLSRDRVNTTHSAHIKLRMTPAMVARLDLIKSRGGYPTRTEMIRSMLLAIINDDAKAHGEPVLEEVA